MRNSRQSWESELTTLQRKANANKHKKCKRMCMGKTRPQLHATKGFQTDYTPEQHLDIKISDS